MTVILAAGKALGCSNSVFEEIEDWNGDWERDQGESGVGRNTEKRQRNRGRRRGNEGGVTEHESVWWT